MARPLLLDLFCGAGGAAVGYHRAGFDVVGVDIEPQPRYPFEFVLADALELMRLRWRDGRYDAVHASPPCQAYTNASNRWRGQESKADSHPDLVAPTRRLLKATGLPWVMENVPGAEMPNRIVLHGGMFGLRVARPRLFESSHLLMLAKAPRTIRAVGVYGDKPDGRRLSNATSQRAASSLEEASAAMGIDWMTWDELRLAIPPAYTEFIGSQLLEHLGVESPV